MLEVKLFFLHLHWIHPLCSPTGLLFLSGLIVDVPMCLFVEGPCSFFVYFTAMHLFGLNWQLQELDNQPAFENGGAGKTGPTQLSIVTALAADGEETKA